MTLPAGALRAAGLMLLGATFYQFLLSMSGGVYEPACLMMAALLIVMAVTAGVLPVAGRPRPVGPLLVAVTGFVTVVWSCLNLFAAANDQSQDLLRSIPDWPPLMLAAVRTLSVAAIVGCVFAIGLAWRQRQSAALKVLVAAGVLQGLMIGIVLCRLPAPVIDVWSMQREASAALLHGENPYTISYPNVYDPTGNNSPLIAKELQRNGRVMSGYCYPPTSLYPLALGRLITADPRATLWAMFFAAGVLTALLGRGPLSVMAAAVLILSPSTLPFLYNSWTEPELLLALVGVAWTGLRRPRWLAVALGLFLSLKQYTPIFFPLLFLLLPRPLTWKGSLKFLTITLGTAAAVTLPLVVWDAGAFWRSAVRLFLITPFRADSFSFLAMYVRELHPATRPGSGVTLLALLPVWAVLLWRLPRNISGFLLGVPAITVTFFLFGRQSFLNYHVFAVGAMLIAAATLEGFHRNAGPNTAALSTHERP